MKSVIETFAFTEPPLPNNEIIESLQNELPSEKVYFSELLKAPTTIYRILENHLVIKTAPYDPHPDIMRINHELPKPLFTNESNRELTCSLLQKYDSQGRSLNQQPSFNSNTAPIVSLYMLMRIIRRELYQRKTGSGS